MDLGSLLPGSGEDKFLRLPYAERLEKLKPIIVQLYMGNYGPGGKRMTMRHVTEFMKDKYSFHMAQNQLENTLRKWNVRRRILNHEKDDITTALGKRTHAGASISDVTLQEGKPVDKKQLKRHLQDKIRRHVVEPMAPGVLSTWNLPYSALKNSIIRQPDIASPFGDTPLTPNYITVNSPDTTGKSPLAMASPSMQLIRQRFRQDLSNLLLQGQLKELFIKCSEEDRIILTNYMHEFWIHTFVTAKHWGRGPLLWTIDMIAELTLTPPVIPSSATTTPASCFAPSPLPPQDEATFLPTPSQHCRWVIHVTHKQQYASKEEDKMTIKSSHPLEEPWSKHIHFFIT
ncbi:clr5 domain-containing protein [Trichoderma breve]|uniref:Clr5 domain-containing protein n=1 Tax=Trichoderma breve TaxID=2034170 RepID=A0A9W9JR44_9HYPO|nr:clr5 domain-containing protein [Trichoderma breve]KAJ4864300.1 clr5 domain-containing protein [Trichoderma breve]